MFKESTPFLFDESKPMIALTDAQMTQVGNSDGTYNVTCSFKRENTKPSDLNLNETEYFEIDDSKEYFVFTAFGSGN